MKTLLIITTLICSFSAFGQVKRPAPKPTPPPVKTAEEKLIDAGFILSPFDNTLAKLPPNFMGHPIPFLAINLYEKYAGMSKGEFETTEQFNQRKAAARNEPLLKNSSLNSQSLIAATVSEYESGYNADKEYFFVNLYLPERNGNDEYSFKYFEINKPGTPYEASNSFGAKVTIQPLEKTTFQVSLIIPGLEGKLVSAHYNMSVPIARDIAPAVKPNLRLLFIGKIFFDTANPVYKGAKLEAPTFQKPIELTNISYALRLKPSELWFYNYETGEIYSKQKFN